MNYYNEHDPYAAEWLRELIKARLIPDGLVDERDIQLVQPGDLRDFIQCHFFAGIAGWSYALQLAGWPEDEPVWTGSCPCQPWSVANQNGGSLGKADARHLWPNWFNLIKVCKPSIIFGENVERAIQLGWLDEVCRDLESEGYTCGSSLLPASAFGADHQRKRVFFVAHSRSEGWEGHQPIQCVSRCKESSQPVNDNPLVGARRGLEGDYSHLSACNGVSVQVERDAIKCAGNAIVPQVAAEFIQASIEALKDL